MDEDRQIPRPGASKLVAAYNRFGFKLLAELVKPGDPQNILISPLSAALPLALMSQGAAGDTRQAILRVLELDGWPGAELNDHNGVLRADLDRLDPQTRTALAAALWVDARLSLAADFLQVSRQFYGAAAKSVDFTDPAAIALVNRWASEATGGKIDHLVDQADLGAETDCILTSAVYFKGLWTTPFDPAATRAGDFHLPSGGRKSVSLMSQTQTCGYLEEEGFQAVSLPYGAGRVSLYVFLPAAGAGPEQLLDHLSTGGWEDWVAGFRQSPVEVVLPRFKVTYESDLKESLGNLGMEVAFGGGADFSPMGLGRHFISKVKHKTMAEVSEEGTEAAATTAVFLGRSLFAGPRIVVNRPFLWVIQDNTNGAILFGGIMTQPEL